MSLDHLLYAAPYFTDTERLEFCARFNEMDLRLVPYKDGWAVEALVQRPYYSPTTRTVGAGSSFRDAIDQAMTNLRRQGVLS